MILFVFIFFYLLLLAGAFVGILAGIFFDPRADVPFGILMLAVMGLVAGQMLYRWKMDLVLVTFLTVGITLASIALGAMGMTSVKGTTPAGKPAAAIAYSAHQLHRGKSRQRHQPAQRGTGLVHSGRSYPSRPPLCGHTG